MSNTFKCDRCGKLFEKKRNENQNLDVTINPYDPSNALDLCNDCYTELKNWKKWWLNMRK